MDNKEKDNSFWKTRRGKAIIKLGLWALFFVLVFIIVNVSSNNSSRYTPTNNTEKVIKYDLYTTMLDSLLKNNYAFEYNIKEADFTVKLSGESDGTNTLGIKETKDGVTKYFIDETGYHKVILNELSEYDNLYEGINEEIINLNTLFNNVKEAEYQVVKNTDTRTINYKLTDYILSVTTDANNITNVKYQKDNTTYDMTFKDIGKVDKLVYNK